ncbi:hypothetical protein ACTFIU_007555 [Dictyostelium citrinum]
MNDFNNRDNNQLFFKVWRNLYLRNQIYYYLKLYNIHRYHFSISSKDYKSYKYKEFIRSIYLCDSSSDESSLKIQDLSNQIESIEFDHFYKYQTILDDITSERINNNNNSYNYSKYHKNIKKLYIQPIYNDNTIKENTLPKSLIKLQFSGMLNQEFTPDIFKNQNKLKKIKIGSLFNNKNKPLSVGTFPNTLESLFLGDHYNLPIEPLVLPTGLKEIEFGREFNQDLNINDVLPPSLTSIKLSSSFQNFPISLKTFKSLPNLQVLFYPNLDLNLLKNNNVDIDDIFPNLRELLFSTNCNTTKEKLKLPSSVTNLNCFNVDNTQFQSISLHQGIKNITNNHLFTNDSFSGSGGGGGELKIERMTIQAKLNPIDIKNSFLNVSIPSFKTLNIMFFNDLITEPIFPNTITSLSLSSFDQPIQPNTFPKSLKHLSFMAYNQPFITKTTTTIKTEMINQQLLLSSSSLPWYNLEALELGGKFLQSFPREMSLPNLKFLRIHVNNYQSIFSTLFPNLESLILSYTSIKSQVIETETLFRSLAPNKIKYIEISNGLYFDKPINDESIVLPTSLATISITNCSNPNVLNLNSPIPSQLKALLCYSTNSNFILKNIDQLLSILKVIKLNYTTYLK